MTVCVVGPAVRPVASLSLRLGFLPERVTAVIEAAADLLTAGDTGVALGGVTAEAARLANVLRRYHEEHPLDPGMSLQALRAAGGAPAPPPAVVDAVLEGGTRGGGGEAEPEIR